MTTIIAVAFFILVHNVFLWAQKSVFLVHESQRKNKREGDWNFFPWHLSSWKHWEIDFFLARLVVDFKISLKRNCIRTISIYWYNLYHLYLLELLCLAMSPCVWVECKSWLTLSPCSSEPLPKGSFPFCNGMFDYKPKICCLPGMKNNQSAED